MTDWIFEGNEHHYDLAGAVASSREQWWGTPHSFRGFEGSNVPVPAEIASLLEARVTGRLEPLE